MPTLEMILAKMQDFLCKNGMIMGFFSAKIPTFAKQTGRFVYFTRQFALFPLKMVPV